MQKFDLLPIFLICLANFGFKTMRFTQPGISEAALAAHFEYICTLSGAQRLAYVPVVASG